MKKFISVFIAITFVLGVSAQRIQKDPAGKLNNKTSQSQQKAPALTDAGDITWGYYSGSSSDWGGVGVGQKATFGVAIFVPGDVFNGAKLKAIRIPVLDPNMTDVSAWVTETLGGNNVRSESTSGSFNEHGYTEVKLSEAYTITSNGVYVGYTFTSSEAYPIAVAGSDVKKALYLQVNGGSWDDYYGNNFGVSPLQIVVGDVDMKDYNASFTELQVKRLLPNTKFKTSAVLSNTSNNPINSIDYTIDVDGKKEQKHLDLTNPIPAGVDKKDVVEVEGTSAAEAKTYTVKLTIEKVNGQPNSQDGAISATFLNVSREVSRRTVVEEFTGTGCGYCPRGWVGMERMKKNYPESFIGIAFHQYNSSDPMYVANYYPLSSLGISGAPGCNMDRRLSTDPYYGTGYGIWNDLEAFNAILPTIDVKAEAQWNQDSTAVDIKATVEALTSDVGFTVAYVLTADSLSGTTNSWRQSNYYYQYSASQLGDDAELNQFARGGKYGQSNVFLVFNDVMIGSSYGLGGKNQADVIAGSDNAQLETLYEGNYSVEMPTKAALLNAIHKDLVFANVLVISNATGEILNAARVAVTEGTVSPEEPKDPELSFSETAFEVEEGSEFTAPELNNPNNVPVTYSSSDVAVAQVDENTGAVTIGTPGTTTITATFAGDDEYLEASASYTITVKEKEKPFVTEINVEREVGLGYGVTSYEPDFTEALAYLGIENPTDATLVGINADGSEEAAPGPGGIDGWCDAEGNFVGWHQGGDSRICVKFFPSVPQYEICDMNGADEVGKTYTVKYGLKANGKMAVFAINVTFVEAQEVKLSLSENVIKARVEYESDEVSYVERKVVLTDDQVNEIITDLGLASLAEATVYGWNPTTEEFLKSYAAFDGWRDANGDFANWTGNATVPACVKYTDGKTYLCYNIKDCEPQEIKCYWAISNNKRAVLVEITFAYVVPSGITELNADEQTSVIYNINGVRMQNTNQKGVYIVNGKKVLVK